MDDSFDCEGKCDKKLLFGSHGVCNFTADTCICPPDFTGIDDFVAFTDSCHVSLKLREALLIIGMITSSVALVITFFGAIYLAREWELYPRITMNTSQRPSETDLGDGSKTNLSTSRGGPGGSFFAEGDIQSRIETEHPTSKGETVNATSASVTVGKLLKKDEKRKQIKRKNETTRRNAARRRASFAMVICFMITNLSFVIYTGFSLQGFNRTDNLFVLDFFGEMFTPFLISALYAWFYSVFLTLPDLKRYGGMLNLNAYLVRRPRFMPKLLVLMTIGVFIWHTALVIAVVTMPDVRFQVAIAHWVGLILFLSVPCFLYEFLVRSVEKVMNMTADSFSRVGQEESTEELDAIARSLKAAQLLRYGYYPPVLSAVGVAILSLGLGNRHAYFFFNSAVVFASSFNGLVTWVSIRYTDGGLVPRIKPIGKSVKPSSKGSEPLEEL